MTETERAPIDWSKPLETEDGAPVKYVGEGDCGRWVEISGSDGSRSIAVSHENGVAFIPRTSIVVDIRNVAPPAPKTVEREPVAWKVFNEDGSGCKDFDDKAEARKEYDRRMKLYRGASPFPHPYAFIQPIYAESDLNEDGTFKTVRAAMDHTVATGVTTAHVTGSPPDPETKGWRVRNEDGSENQIFAKEADAIFTFWRRFDAWRRKMPVFEKAGGGDE